MPFEPISPELERVATQVVDAAFKLHKMLGPGLLESVYVKCLQHELERPGLLVQREVPVDVVYEGLRIEGGLRIDLLVEGQLIIEVKAVEKMNDLFQAQLLTYLKLTGNRLGFLINFNTVKFNEGIKRMAL